MRMEKIHDSAFQLSIDCGMYGSKLLDFYGTTKVTEYSKDFDMVIVIGDGSSVSSTYYMEHKLLPYARKTCREEGPIIMISLIEEGLSDDQIHLPRKSSREHIYYQTTKADFSETQLFGELLLWAMRRLIDLTRREIHYAEVTDASNSHYARANVLMGDEESMLSERLCQEMKLRKHDKVYVEFKSGHVFAVTVTNTKVTFANNYRDVDIVLGTDAEPVFHKTARYCKRRRLVRE